MSDSINRQAVINAIANTCFWLSGDDWNELIECINSVPSADVKPNIHAYWESIGEAFQCSHCGTLCAVTETATHFIHHIGDKFCRGCGAMMDAEPKGANDE